MNIRFNSRTDGGNSVAARVFMTLFGLAFSGFALLFMGIAAKDVLADWRVSNWTETPATVVSSRVIPGTGSQSTHGFEIEYEYQWNAHLHTGSELRRKPVEETDISVVERLALEYPPGVEVTAHVNPENPDESVIEAGIGGSWLMVLFAIPFLAVGLGVIALAWWKGEKSAHTKTAISNAKKSSNTGCLILFFGLFALVGGIVTLFTFVRPVYKIIDARDWMEVTCVIESSTVRSHQSDDGTTYSVDILYHYQMNGRELRSNRYTFATGSSSGRDGKARIASRYPVGSTHTCFVNPHDPTDAVLVRDFTAGTWLGLFPAIFLAVGVGGMFFTLRSLRRRGLRDGGGDATRTSSSPNASDAGERVLRPRTGPWKRLLGGIFIAVFWNGITSVFVVQVVKSHLRDRPEWFLTLFMIPFVLIGLGMIAYVVHAFFGLFNPRPQLRLRPGTPRLGKSVDCDWAFTGNVKRVRRLTITIEGVEESQYRRGTRTYTDTSVFARLPLVETDHPAQIQNGGLTTVLPIDRNAPSFKADNNRIYWAIKLQAEIPRWPDVSEQYEIPVLPAVSAKVETGAPTPVAAQTTETVTDEGARLSLQIDAGESGLEPGDTVRGTARWSLPTSPKMLEVRLFWFTEGKGTRDTVVVSEQPIPPTPVGETPVALQIPSGEPPSIDGSLLSVIWAVELVSDLDGAVARVEFNVGNGSEPIKLDALPGAKEKLKNRIRWSQRG